MFLQWIQVPTLINPCHRKWLQTTSINRTCSSTSINVVRFRTGKMYNLQIYARASPVNQSHAVAKLSLMHLCCVLYQAGYNIIMDRPNVKNTFVIKRRFATEFANAVCPPFVMFSKRLSEKHQYLVFLRSVCQYWRNRMRLDFDYKRPFNNKSEVHNIKIRFVKQANESWDKIILWHAQH